MIEEVLTQEKIDLFHKIYNRANDRFKPYVLLENNSYGFVGWFLKIKIRKSIKELKTCLDIIPNHINSMFGIGKCYQSLGEDMESLEWFEKGLQINFSQLSYEEDEAKYKILINYCLLEASVIAAKKNDFAKAVNYSERILESEPQNISVLGNLAMNFIITEKDIEAKKTIVRALSISPSDTINNDINKFLTKLKDGVITRPKAWNDFKFS